MRLPLILVSLMLGYVPLKGLKLVALIGTLEPTFGTINLEDI